MKRLTKRNIHGVPYYPECFDKCAGKGPSIKCHCCYFEHEIIIKLAEYEDLEEQGRLIKVHCKEGDEVWELCKCDDGIYRIFPMTVKLVSEYGSIRGIVGGSSRVWNIYATSDYTYMYKRFDDIGETLFLTKEEAEKALERMEK